MATLFGTRIDVDGPSLTRVQQLYLLMLVLLVIFALLARNLARSRTGRAFAAIRDRDIAAGGDRRESDPVQGDRVRGLLVLRRSRRRAALCHSADVLPPATSTC